MKKLLALLLVLTTTMGLAACRNKGADKNPTTDPTTQPTTEATIDTTVDSQANGATQVLTTIWNAVAEDKKFFAMGGDMENMVDNAPGNYSLTDEGITTVLCVPADQVQHVDQASSLIHGMMANHFTGAVLHMANGADASAFADAMKANIDSTRWLCGTPEKLLIAVIDGQYVLAAFGLTDNINAFETALATAYADSQIKYSEAIIG